MITIGQFYFLGLFKSSQNCSCPHHDSLIESKKERLTHELRSSCCFLFVSSPSGPDRLLSSHMTTHTLGSSTTLTGNVPSVSGNPSLVTPCWEQDVVEQSPPWAAQSYSPCRCPRSHRHRSPRPTAQITSVDAV